MESPLRPSRLLEAEPPAGSPPVRNGRRYADTTSDLSLLMSSAIDSDGFYTQQQVLSTLEVRSGVQCCWQHHGAKGVNRRNHPCMLYLPGPCMGSFGVASCNQAGSF